MQFEPTHMQFEEPSELAEASVGSTTSNLQLSAVDAQSRISGQSFADPDIPDFAFIYASPLIDHKRPVPLIDHNQECTEVFDALRRAQVGLRAVSDVATTRTLRRLLTQGVTMLHYCGHGIATASDNGSDESGANISDQDAEAMSASGFSLVLEDGRGGAHHLPARDLHELVAAGGHALQLVFVSACHSLGGGAAFVNAGVPHVVAVKRTERIQDRAACIFAEAFYFGLLRGGKTVQQAFDIGRSAVASAVGIRDSEAEANKFVLLPANQPGRHDRCLSSEVLGWKRGHRFVDASPPEPRTNLPAFNTQQFIGRHAEWHALLINLTHPHKRLSAILGTAGVGKSTLCVAASHNLVQRRIVDAALYINVAECFSAAELFRAVGSSLGEAALHRRSLIARLRDASHVSGQSCETLPEALQLLVECLPSKKSTLMVIDDAEPFLRLAAGRLAVRQLIAGAMRRLPLLRVLMCCQMPLHIRGFPQCELQLMPLKPTDATRLFMLATPRRLESAEIFDGWELKVALEHEVGTVATMLGYSAETLVVSQHQADAMPRATWNLPGWTALQALVALLNQDETIALTIAAQHGTSVTLSLSLQRRLARSPVLRSADGNPRALNILAFCMDPAGAPRPLRMIEGMVLDYEGVAAPAAAPSAAAGSNGRRVSIKTHDANDVLRAMRQVDELKRRYPREPSPERHPKVSRMPSWMPQIVRDGSLSAAASAAPSMLLRPLGGADAVQICLIMAVMALLWLLLGSSGYHSAPLPPPPPSASSLVWAALFSPHANGGHLAAAAPAASSESYRMLLVAGLGAALALLALNKQAPLHPRGQDSQGATAQPPADDLPLQQQRGGRPARRVRQSSGSYSNRLSESAVSVSSSEGGGGVLLSNSDVLPRRRPSRAPSLGGASSVGHTTSMGTVGVGSPPSTPLHHASSAGPPSSLLPPSLELELKGDQKPLQPPPLAVSASASASLMGGGGGGGGLRLPTKALSVGGVISEQPPSPPRQQLPTKALSVGGVISEQPPSPPRQQSTMPPPYTQPPPPNAPHPSPYPSRTSSYEADTDEPNAEQRPQNNNPQAQAQAQPSSQQGRPVTLLEQLVAVFASAGASEHEAELFAPHIMPVLKPLIVDSGKDIVQVGDEGDEMYFITDGLVEIVSSTGINLYATKTTGDFFGEATCLQCCVEGFDNKPRTRRTATVRAMRRSQLWSLSSADLLPALLRFPAVHAALMKTANDRIAQTCAMLAARLGTLLTDVIPDESRGAFFSQLAPRMRPLSVAEGDYVIRQGDVNDDLYFLCDGEVEILASGPQPNSQPTVVARKTPVSFFGEVAALKLGPAARSASVRARTQSLLWRVKAADLQEVLKGYPSIAAIFEGIAKARVVDTIRKSASGTALDATTTTAATGAATGAAGGAGRPAPIFAGGDRGSGQSSPTKEKDGRMQPFRPPSPPLLGRQKSNGSFVAAPQQEQMSIVAGISVSSRQFDIQYDNSIAHPTRDSVKYDTLDQVGEAKLVTQQTIAALERQLGAEHLKLKMLENVESALHLSPKVELKQPPLFTRKSRSGHIYTMARKSQSEGALPSVRLSELDD